MRLLRFEMDLIAADLAARTIEGVVVPYGEVGRIGGESYRFRPGSLELARNRTPLLVDHDRRAPVGVLAELVDGDQGPLGRFRVDETPAGDTALVQAASGSRGALSVGAEVLETEDAAGGVVDVTRARLIEVSLVAFGAFTGAEVTRVAAEADEPRPDDAPGEEAPPPPAEPGELQEPLPEPETPAAPATPEPPEEGTMTEATAAPVIIAAGADRPARELLAGELVGLIVRAQHGEPEARRYLEAALQESISTDVSGLLPPQYERTVIGGKQTPRPLYEVFRSRPLPGVGLAVNKPKWTTRPDGQWAATVDDDAHSTKVVIGSQAANVERWDWAGAIPWVVVQRSDPSVVDEIYAEAVQDFYLDVETKIATELEAAATDASDSLGAGIAAFYGATDKAPDVMIVAPDVWGVLADTGALQNPTAAGGVSTSGGLSSSFGGIPIVASGSLAPGTRILATRRAVDARVTDPVRLTANAIGALNVELAVVGEGLFDTDYPDELMALTPVAPGALAAQASAKTSK
jgi:HK97 family phage prohead protease